MTCFTPFSTDVSHIALPETFTFPFCYEPHPLSQVAAEQLQQHLQSQTDWQYDFERDGKMFGVLVVKDTNNRDRLPKCFFWQACRPKPS